MERTQGTFIMMPSSHQGIMKYIVFCNLTIFFYSVQFTNLTQIIRKRHASLISDHESTVYIYFAPALQLKSFMMNEQLKRIEMPSSFHVVCPLEENI